MLSSSIQVTLMDSGKMYCVEAKKSLWGSPQISLTKLIMYDQHH